MKEGDLVHPTTYPIILYAMKLSPLTTYITSDLGKKPHKNQYIQLYIYNILTSLLMEN